MNDDPELMRVFSHLILVGSTFSPKGLETDTKKINELLEPCGLTVTRTDCSIIDKSRVGESTVTIARYSIEYRQKGGAKEREIVAEGALAMETDRFGNMNISIRTRSLPHSSRIDTFDTEAILIGGKNSLLTPSQPLL